jgi:hypothetical protein
MISESLKNESKVQIHRNDEFSMNDQTKWIFGLHFWNYDPEKAPAGSAYFLMD